MSETVRREIADQEYRKRCEAAGPEMVELLARAPILSKFHGQHGFEQERFIASYETWRAEARALLSSLAGEDGHG
jgi:hypothetical protein